jgi:hypothetical protein
MRSTRRRENSRSISRCTNMRLAETQVWPALRILEAITFSTASFQVRISKTMKGAWPPSSSESRLTVSAAPCMRILPTSVEPVNDSLRTLRSSMTADERSAGSIPVTTESTPFGSPASSKALASSSAESGASSEGFTTIAHPAAKAAPTLRATEDAGSSRGSRRRRPRPGA